MRQRTFAEAGWWIRLPPGFADLIREFGCKSSLVLFDQKSGAEVNTCYVRWRTVVFDREGENTIVVLSTNSDFFKFLTGMRPDSDIVPVQVPGVNR